jgi:hypothetical protein
MNKGNSNSYNNSSSELLVSYTSKTSQQAEYQHTPAPMASLLLIIIIIIIIPLLIC